jgi:N-acetylmuramoyl-L-alanine amidase
MSGVAFPAESSVVAEVLPSPNHGERKSARRPDMIVLHYTGMPLAAAALDLLRAPGSQVSAHYFVFEDGRVIQLVQESRRAWHAGAAVWAGETDINSCSIGIEIANPGHDHGYPDFPKRQIAAVTALCRGILTRNTIPADRVLAHSDVAPARKRDPGEKFPWRMLYDSGVGHWVKPARITDGTLFSLGDRGDEVAAIQTSLSDYGYGIAVNGNYDSQMHETVTAFQRHFRPERIDGVSDASTRSTLKDVLIHRGRPRTMAARVISFDRLVVAS